MSQLQRAFKTLGGMALVVFLPVIVQAQSTNTGNNFAPSLAQTAIITALGDQSNPSVSVAPNGGYVVWQDNVTDGDGLGISAIKVDGTFTPSTSFRVNQNGTNDQENARVAMIPGGGAAFVWQGGQLGFQHIYARFLSSSNLWITNDIMVNASTNFYQADPAIAALPGGNVIVTWSSYGQDYGDRLQGIYGQLFTSTGTKINSEFLINQYTPNNQRASTVAAFTNGGFIVAWVSEKERSASVSLGSDGTNNGYNSVDIYARTYNSNGGSTANEFLVNTSTNICTQPTVATGPNGTYVIAWAQRDSTNLNNGWDVFARSFSSANTGGNVILVNSQRYGDQYQPKIAAIGTNYLVVWTSMAQDGSREGVYSQVLQGDATHVGVETRVNTTVLNSQISPAVSSDGSGRFLVVWASYVGLSTGMDIYSQQFANTAQPLVAPSAPLVMPIDSYTLSVTWPPLAGFTTTNFTISYFDLYIDGSINPVHVTNNAWSSVNFNPSSTHTFALDYVLTDGRVSPVSSTASGTTWGADRNYDGLPDDWETNYFGPNSANWPTANTLLAPGVTVLKVFMWGANPNDPTTWLKQSIIKTSQGYYLTWNTVPGAIYQVQSSTNASSWNALGAARFEPGNTDSIYLGLGTRGFYRIVRNRY